MSDRECAGCAYLGRPHNKGCPNESYGDIQQRFNQRNPGLREPIIQGNTTSPADRIRARIAEHRKTQEYYRQHAIKMLGLNDAHGAWDAAVSVTEFSCAADEAEACLAIVEGREP